jgi:hypothetical protein
MLLYALIMWVSIANLDQHKPIIVTGFFTPAACNQAANDVISQLRLKVPGATETHTCEPSGTVR